VYLTVVLMLIMCYLSPEVSLCNLLWDAQSLESAAARQTGCEPFIQVFKSSVPVRRFEHQIMNE